MWRQLTALITKTLAKKAEKPDVTMVDIDSSDVRTPTSSTSILDLTPEIRTRIYGFVLKDFEITLTDPEERDLAVPILNVSRFIAEEALDTYKKRVQTSKQKAAEELRKAEEALGTTLRYEGLPELDFPREKVAICEEELIMIAEVKKQYGMK